MGKYRKITYIIALILLISASGCAYYPKSISDILGSGYTDLIDAKSTGIKIETSLTPEKAFESVLNALLSENIVIFKEDTAKKYLITMGYPKQVNTTRVGLFFETSDDGKTVIIVSSLSSTAKDTAAAMIRKTVPQNE